MPLDDLNKQLYNAGSDEGSSKQEHESSAYDPFSNTTGQASPFEQQEHWERPKEAVSKSRKKKTLIGLLIFLVIVLLVGGGFFYKWWLKNAFHQDRVSISFEGPNEADSTQSTKYIIHYVNNNRVTLKNAEIQLTYSENFQPTDNLNLKYLSPTSSKIFIGDIKPRGQGSAELKGIFYAPKDSPVYINGQIHFIPSNGVTDLFVESKLGVRVTASPMSLGISAPKEAVDGDTLEYVIDYKNLDVKSVNGVQVRVNFPQEFKVEDSLPRVSEKENIWYVGNLESGQAGKVRIRGKIAGKDGDGRNITVIIGHPGENDEFIVYDKQELITRMVAPILTVSQRVDGKNSDVVNPGEILKYSIVFKNTGASGLRDAIVSVEIRGKILDFSKINPEKGYYDSSKGIITWKASDVPELANINPGAGGVVYFSIPVKSSIPIENKLDKNLIISSLAKIDSPDIPTPVDSNKIIGSNKLELKLASKVLFDVNGYYADSKIKNTGPLPLETKSETTFTIHWSVVNVSNDIAEAKVVSSFPSGVRWTGEIFPANEKLSYNIRTNQLIWDAGSIPAGTGVISPVREVAFKVGVMPQVSDIGKPIDLINKSVFTAKDTFVNLGVTLEGASKNTTLREDPMVGFVRGKVAR